MKSPKFLPLLTDQLNSSAKFLVLITVTVALTSLAIILSADFVRERRLNELHDHAQRYTAELKTKIKDEEEKILSIASLERSSEFMTFGERAKRLMQEYPVYSRIELRDDSGMLLAQRESVTSKEVWTPKGRLQLPPSVLLSFMRAHDQQKVYWAHSYSPEGQSTPEMVLPARGGSTLWVVRVDPRFLAPPSIGYHPCTQHTSQLQ